MSWCKTKLNCFKNVLSTAAAFQSGKIQHNPFNEGGGPPQMPGGAAVPPPSNYGGPRGPMPPRGPMGGHMMGGPPGGPRPLIQNPPGLMGIGPRPPSKYGWRVLGKLEQTSNSWPETRSYHSYDLVADMDFAQCNKVVFFAQCIFLQSSRINMQNLWNKIRRYCTRLF